MTQYKLTINGTATYGNLQWNANGTLKQLAITDPFNVSDAQTCNYGYDDLARVASVDCGASIWQQNFAYDPFGNIIKSVPLSGTGIAFNPGYDPATNRYTDGAIYDLNGNGNGNLTNDGTDHQYSWDTDGHPVTLDSLNLIYDALGREVEKQNGSANTEFVYGPTGKLALMNGQTQTKGFVPLPGGTQVKYIGSSISTYRLPDWLGSFRVGSNPNRTYSWGIAFAPFGEQYAQSGSPAWSFTGEEGTADTVSDEYDFQARKLHSTQGRWISPDPLGLSAADPTNPQSWNRYAYVLNNPLSFVDPTGLFCQWVDGTRDDEEGDGGASFQDCVGDPNNEGTWIDTVSITVNGDAAYVATDTFENGSQIFPDTLYNPANTGTIRPLKGQEYDDALNAYCSARGRAKFVADWLPGGGTIARDLWNSPTGAALGAYQLSTSDINRITEDNSGAQTVAMHGASEGLQAAAGSTAVLYALRAQTGVPMTVGSKMLSGAATIVLVADAVFGFVKEGQEILNCQAGN